MVGEDDFFADLGISYKDFDMPDEVDDFYEAKDDPVIAKDRWEDTRTEKFKGKNTVRSRLRNESL